MLALLPGMQSMLSLPTLFVLNLPFVKCTRRTPSLVGTGPNQGAKEMLGSEWRPYQDVTFVTPAFPEFVSGHSTFSYTAAVILDNFFDSDKFFDGKSAVLMTWTVTVSATRLVVTLLLTWTFSRTTTANPSFSSGTLFTTQICRCWLHVLRWHSHSRWRPSWSRDW